MPKIQLPPLDSFSYVDEPQLLFLTTTLQMILKLQNVNEDAITKVAKLAQINYRTGMLMGAEVVMKLIKQIDNTPTAPAKSNLVNQASTHFSLDTHL